MELSDERENSAAPLRSHALNNSLTTVTWK